jgi:hypothetical protein
VRGKHAREVEMFRGARAWAQGNPLSSVSAARRAARVPGYGNSSSSGSEGEDEEDEGGYGGHNKVWHAAHSSFTH